jgi:hypothetical protein
LTKRQNPKDRSRHPDAEKRCESASDRAAAMKRQWTMLRQRHVLVGGACACGHGQNHMGADDFEYFVLDHLARKYRASGRANLLQILDCGDGTAGSLQTLLDRLTQPDTSRRVHATELSLLLDDLQRSVASFADSAI